MQLPLTLLTTLCVLFFMPLKKVEGDWRLWVPLIIARVPADVVNSKLKAVDFLGIFLALAGMTVVILGLTWGGKEYSWNSAQVIATLVVGTAASVAFMLWQWKGPRYPLIPRKKLYAIRQSVL
jgi:predicted membrane channel-forming protein YqfA (hemolysin III family)